MKNYIYMSKFKIYNVRLSNNLWKKRRKMTIKFLFAKRGVKVMDNSFFRDDINKNDVFSGETNVKQILMLIVQK